MAKRCESNICQSACMFSGKTIRAFLAFRLLVLICILASCGFRSVWGQSRDDFFASLENHDYGFIDSIPTERYSEILSLGEGAPWFLGLHLVTANHETEALALFSLGAKKCEEPFKTLCLSELTRFGTPQARLSAVEALIAHLSNDKNNPVVGAVPGTDLRALESQKFSILLELGSFDGISGGIEAWYESHSITQSLVAAYSALPSDLPQVFLDVTSVRLDVYRRSYREAWGKAKPILDSYVAGNPSTRLTRLELSDFGKAALYGSTETKATASFFDALSAKADDLESKYILTFYAGRLYGKESPQAQERFSATMKLAQNDGDIDSALWYLLDSAMDQGPEVLISALGENAKKWKKPEAFNDILVPFIASLAQSQDWKALLSLRKALPENTDSQILSRLNYLAARSGLLNSADARSAYRQAFDQDHGSLYYRALSAEALGVSLGSSEVLRTVSPRKPAGNPAQGVDKVASAILRGFITWHLEERVWPMVSASYPDISVSFAKELASSLSSKGFYGDSIRIMITALGNSSEPITDDDLREIYPRPWLSEVSAAAARFGIPEYYLYALMRSESYFDAGVISGAGAVGLTQLMKPTASDIARKLKVETFDLKDPGTNITFGAYYLSELVGRLDGKMLNAFFAYNAGITRVREWQKNAPQDEDLFLESLPYGETREYGRKVLAAAAVYGYLYYQKNPEQIVRDLF